MRVRRREPAGQLFGRADGGPAENTMPADAGLAVERDGRFAGGDM